jgi:hypothetical protein
MGARRVVGTGECTGARAQSSCAAMEATVLGLAGSHTHAPQLQLRRGAPNNLGALSTPWPCPGSNSTPANSFWTSESFQKSINSQQPALSISDKAEVSTCFVTNLRMFNERTSCTARTP